MPENRNRNDFLSANGDIVAAESLTIPRCRSLVRQIESDRLSFVKLIECRRTVEEANDVKETVVFDAEIERPQRRVHDIRRVERIAVTFSQADNWYPEVLALRVDFPEVPHLNLRDTELPRSLCLYDESWPAVAMRWTPVRFVERIRLWLAETAQGTLHQADQPLEPVLLGNLLTVVLPPDLFRDWTDSKPKRLQIGPAFKGDDCRTYDTNTDPDAGGAYMVAVCVKTEPRRRTAINRQPGNLSELCELVATSGCDLRRELANAFNDVDENDRWKRKLLIIVGFPLIRDDSASIEITDTWAFLIPKSIAEVGIAIGLWMQMPGEKQLGLSLNGLCGADDESVPVVVMSPQFGLSRQSAAASSATQSDVTKTIAIGAGALGSQVIELLTKSGFGNWTIVDNDDLAPHNIARHALSSMWIGWPKSRALAIELSTLYHSDPTPRPHVGDFVRDSTGDQQLAVAVGAAELILDLSASVPVARHVANDLTTQARRCSIFLNPSGSDLVVFFEDSDRKLPLDCIEIQYYRAIAFQDGLDDHLQPPDGRGRYARSCRDVSSSIPTNQVALLASIAAGEVRPGISSPLALACLWRTRQSPTRLDTIPIELSAVERTSVGEWTLVVSRHVVDRLSELRSAKLPNETGGVLVGSYDLGRKIVYVVETIESPPDSQEWPTLYIRGSRGLAAEMERVGQITNGQLEYIGEWHSHPDGCSCRPSDDDFNVFAWLTENMDDAGLPALMAIAGQLSTAWFVGEISETGGWETDNYE